MKIGEIENKMKADGFDSIPFSEYITALNRVRGESIKCQHCYITALGLSDSDFQNAINLIIYGPDYARTWLDRYRTYDTMGIVYERHGDYENAKAAYLKALDASHDAPSNSYVYSICNELMRVEMHISNFAYTSDFASFYNAAIQADDFSKSFRKTKFYLSLAEMILFIHRKDPSRVENARNAAYRALDGETVTAFDRLMKRHRYADEAHATRQALRFLQKAGR